MSLDEVKNMHNNDETNLSKKAPHAVVIPYPAQGHIKGMLKMAKLLHHKGFHITFVNTEFNHRRYLKSRGPHAMDGAPGFRFETIPDGLPPSNEDATQDVPALCQAIRTVFLPPFMDLIRRINRDGLSPPVTCTLSDGVMPFAIDAAEQLGIPVVTYYTFGACGFLGWDQYRPLMDRGLTPLKDESELTEEYLNTKVDWLPGFDNLRIRDLPALFQTTDPNHPIFHLAMEAAEAVPRASALGIETYESLEPKILNYLSTKFPNVFAVGPLQLLLNRISSTSNSPYLDSVGYNMWVEAPECLKWLDSMGDKTVVYVNFGSITPVTPQQFIEFAWGLANSKQHFLWIIRPDMVMGESSVLPPGFLEETKGRCMIAGWCDQDEVLNHPAVGGFLTHSGWNSTIESLSAGVPMICWPFFADQQTNCRHACEEWKVALEIDNDVKRVEVEKLVKDLMEGEKGKEMRCNASVWKKLAETATTENGSSSINLDKLISVLLSKV
ncbi:7-deoxyloganetin glucosyltransferase-like [Impatiens glandulifera]|uniref:7-deoxyloganetin glucosyltransferase-like n=1 Tax=Impatiens glandulifera TaxID=253017 RepID=UPI001FB102F0|nr:7-deoxyloganetin glucosyltransferase-like [Impatiens glandulifera]